MAAWFQILLDWFSTSLLAYVMCLSGFWGAVFMALWRMHYSSARPSWAAPHNGADTVPIVSSLSPGL